MSDYLKESILKAVDFMAVSAITAPKTKGENFMNYRVIDGEEIDELALAMIEYGENNNKQKYCRDGKNVRESNAIILLSSYNAQPPNLNCGACGKDKCSQLNTSEKSEFAGPLCAWRILDLGIAIGSAVKTASLFNLDNRIMYRIGSMARKIGMIKGDFVIGIAVSVSGKNIYFDRK